MREQRPTSKAIPRMGDTLAEVLAGMLLSAAIVFGGGSRGAGDLVVHVVAVLALAAGVMRWRTTSVLRSQRFVLYWLGAVLLVLVLQLVPLPATLFAMIPRRAQVLADLGQAGLTPAWLPMTLDTWGTVRALLAVMTLGAAWLLASTLDAQAQVRLLGLALILGVAMALLGFAQAAGGEHSRLRPYAYHHPIGAIGSFANRNHFADLMAMLVPVGLFFAFNAQTRNRSTNAIIWYAVAVVLFLAGALSFSRAGIALMAMATAAAFVLMSRARRKRARDRGVLPILAAGVASAGVAIYAWDGIAQRLVQDPLGDLRWQYLRYGIEAAKAYFPFGSGAGSFRDVYAPFEPVAAMQPVHALHAHNDVLELALETGVPGLLLALFLLVLLLPAAWRALKINSDGRQTSAIIPAAAIAVFVPLAHSFVDYPLRTLAVTTVFAILLAVLTAAPAERVE